MDKYKEFQFGWIIFLFVVPAHVLINYLYLTGFGSQPMNLGSILFGNGILTLIYILFYGLTTQLTEGVLSVSFGIGIIKKKISLDRVAGVKETRNNNIYGWGLRFIPNGIMYNISGNEAVELKFKDSSRVFRIGTQHSTLLKQEIVKHITTSSPPITDAKSS